MKHYFTPEDIDRADIRTGRPGLNWNDKKWQEFYALLKLHVPINTRYIHSIALPSLYLNAGEGYQGPTNFQHYCHYINDVLNTIRHGQYDYCYYIYQIADLYRFEPELKTKLCGGKDLSPYIRVWL